MSEATVALVVAIVGAATGVVSLGWNVVNARQQGPVIKFSATYAGSGDAVIIYGNVRNTGRFDAYLLCAVLLWPKGGHIAVPPDHVTAGEIPGPLPAQRSQDFSITGVASIDPGLSAALRDYLPVQLSFVTESGQVRMRTVKYRM